MLSRKHFKEVAEILNNSQHSLTDVAYRDLINSFSIMFKNDNSRFDREKFRDACYK